MHSLCLLSSSFHVTTKQEGDALGTALTYDIRTGALVKQERVAAKRGTSIQLSQLFHPLPVRRRDLEKKIKTQFATMLSLVQKYAVISTNTTFKVIKMDKKKGSKGRGGMYVPIVALF